MRDRAGKENAPPATVEAPLDEQVVPAVAAAAAAAAAAASELEVGSSRLFLFTRKYIFFKCINNFSLPEYIHGEYFFM